MQTVMMSDYANYHEQISANQRRQREELRTSYDFIICGSGTSGSVVARRLAESDAASVLVLEAGGSDDAPEVENASAWTSNLQSTRDWKFIAEPNPHLNRRTLSMNMGKVLGGGSSINAMYWSRGHQADWDRLSNDTGDSDWSYASVLALYKKIENWRGVSDPVYRGENGLVHIAPAVPKSPIIHACLNAYAEIGLPLFPSQNGSIMEQPEGASISDVCIRDGRRASIFRAYLYPVMHRSNVTVLTDVLVTRVLFDGNRASGVECIIDGRLQRLDAAHEVILSLGAIHTPKVLMQSGVGDAEELRTFGIPVVENLRGVGRNLQDHCMVAGCIWEAPDSVDTADIPHYDAIPQSNAFLRSSRALTSPDIQLIQAGFPLASEDVARRYAFPRKTWALLPALVRPRSTGRIRLTGSQATDVLAIDSNMLSDPADMAALVSAVKIVDEIARSTSLKHFIKRRITPHSMERGALEQFLRESVVSLWHQTCTAKMGDDEDSVVDSKLRVHGLANLTVADGSVLRQVATGNTMAPCVVVGERAALSVKQRHFDRNG